jgi:hypothetical protein
MVSSIEEFSGSVSSPIKVPLTSLNRPLTVEIIKCLTANSAREWVESTRQVVATAVETVLMGYLQTR